MMALFAFGFDKGVVLCLRVSKNFTFQPNSHSSNNVGGLIIILPPYGDL